MLAAHRSTMAELHIILRFIDLETYQLIGFMFIQYRQEIRKTKVKNRSSVSKPSGSSPAQRHSSSHISLCLIHLANSTDIVSPRHRR